MESLRSKFTYRYVTDSIKYGRITDINAVIPALGGLTLLHIAMFNDDERLVDYLLRKGADMHLKSEHWCSVFTAAVLVNNLSKLESLINFGADVNHPIDSSEYYRFSRAEEQYYQGTHRLLSINSSPELGEMFKVSTSATLPLYIAIHGNNVKMVELLLKNNADPNPDAGFYGPPLIHAVVRRNLPIIKLLLAYGSNPNNVKIPYGESPLHLVVKSEDSEAVRTFLNHDTIDINIVSDFKNSALHYAIIYTTNINIIRQLLNAGIDVNLINHLGRTAFTTERLYNLLHREAPDPEKVTDIISEHIVKCSAANFYVNEENLSFVKNWKKFDKLRDQCINEIEKMKRTFIGTSNVTYHFVLSNKCIHKLALSLKYVSDSTISNLDIESIFPLYGGIMSYRLKKALRRKKLLFNAMDLTNDILRELRLPSTFMRGIFSYLSTEDLKKLQ